MALERTHTTTFRVRYSECDPMGVAHHTAYPVWFEIGRTELLRHAHAFDPMPSKASATTLPHPLENGKISPMKRGDSGAGLTYRELESQGIFLAVTALNVRYKRPARYDDQLTLHTKLVGTGHVKIEHEYELFRDSILLATGSTTLACLDREGKPRPLPSALCQP